MPDVQSITQAPFSIEMLQSDIERDLLFHIILNMRHRKISVGEAENLAKEFLTLMPAIDKEDLLNKLNSLGHKYPEAQAVYVKYAAPYEEEKRIKLLQTMTEHIQKGNIEEAISLAKGSTATKQ